VSDLDAIEYTINGRALRDFAGRIETAEGLQSTPGIVGDDVPVVGLDGTLDPYQLGEQRRPDGPGRIEFRLSMLGVNPYTGRVSSAYGSLQDYLDNCDEMIRLLHARPLTIDATRPDGTVRRAIGHLQPGQSLDFTRAVSSPAFGTYVAAIAIPSGRWTDTTDLTVGPLSLATGATVDLSAFAAATAPCTDLVVTIGPCSNPRIEKTDGYFAWAATIAGGRELRLRTAVGVIDAGTGAVWDPGYGAELDYSPGPRMFEIDPAVDLAPTFTHTGGGSASLTIVGPRHYRTS
jgi:hypothetical protein